MLDDPRARPSMRSTGSREWGEAEQFAPVGLRTVDPTALFDLPIPERQWIVQDWLPVGHVTLNYGDGGVGKTLLAQQLMTSCATATPWCGLHVEPCKVLGLFCEDDGDELHRRQEAINAGSFTADGRRLEFTDLGHMRWVSRVGADNLLVTFDHDNRMRLTPLFDSLEAEAIAFGARLVVVDTAADTFGGNENDRAQVRQFIGHALNRLAQNIGGAVLLNAHPSRSGMSAAGDLDGGSTGWSNSSRSRWSLTRPVGEDVPADTPERVLTRRKANYAAKGAEIVLTWKAGLLVPPACQPGAALTAIGREADAQAAFLKLLDRCDAQGVRVSGSKNAPNFAPKVFAKRPDAAGMQAKDFDRAMHALFASAQIRMEDYGRAGDARQRIARVAPSLMAEAHAA
jgi:RecA-family ATPase